MSSRQVTVHLLATAYVAFNLMICIYYYVTTWLSVFYVEDQLAQFALKNDTISRDALVPFPTSLNDRDTALTECLMVTPYFIIHLIAFICLLRADPRAEHPSVVLAIGAVLLMTSAILYIIFSGSFIMEEKLESQAFGGGKVVREGDADFAAYAEAAGAPLTSAEGFSEQFLQRNGNDNNDVTGSKANKKKKGKQVCSGGKAKRKAHAGEYDKPTADLTDLFNDDTGRVVEKKAASENDNQGKENVTASTSSTKMKSEATEEEECVADDGNYNEDEEKEEMETLSQGDVIGTVFNVLLNVIKSIIEDAIFGNPYKDSEMNKVENFYRFERVRNRNMIWVNLVSFILGVYTMVSFDFAPDERKTDNLGLTAENLAALQRSMESKKPKNISNNTDDNKNTNDKKNTDISSSVGEKPLEVKKKE